MEKGKYGEIKNGQSFHIIYRTVKKYSQGAQGCRGGCCNEALPKILKWYGYKYAPFLAPSKENKKIK